MVGDARLVVNNLNVFYGDRHTLKNISVRIPDKKITTIIGPSGCGKTTLLKSFNRLLDLNHNGKVTGSVQVDGEDILSDKVDANRIRKKIGLLSQKPTPLPMSIYENVAYGARIYRMSRTEILSQLKKAQQYYTVDGFEEWLNSCKKGKETDLLVEYYLRLSGLWDEVQDRLHAPAAELSIGQQQRLCLARGLVVEPEIILGDEPTSALDPPSAQIIEERLLALKNYYTIVVVTHTRSQAKRLADYVIFIYLGVLIEAGAAEEVFQNPRDHRTRLYLEGKFIKREFPRSRKDILVEYSVIGGKPLVQAVYTRDIGVGGICITACDEIEINTILLLKIYLPGDIQPIEVKGRVIWREISIRNQDSGRHYDLGIEFIEINEDVRQRIYQKIVTGG